jgi:cell filamentation protein
MDPPFVMASAEDEQMNRYAAGAEGEAQPGSRGRVLRNLLGITSVRKMQVVESTALIAATEQAIRETSADHRFTAADICLLHMQWLGAIYPWAGTYRSVNVSRQGFMFAAAAQVPRLMQELEEGPLTRYTPCRFDALEGQAEALAITHAELVLIHPFREGNGRSARLLAALMALQAGLPLLDFRGVVASERQRYIAAVQAAMDRNYGPMQEVFKRVIARTLRSAGSGR